MRLNFKASIAWSLAPLTVLALSPGAPAPSGLPRPDAYILENQYLQWPRAEMGKQNLTIESKTLHGYVEEISAISRRYRDQSRQPLSCQEGCVSEPGAVRSSLPPKR